MTELRQPSKRSKRPAERFRLIELTLMFLFVLAGRTGASGSGPDADFLQRLHLCPLPGALPTRFARPELSESDPTEVQVYELTQGSRQANLHR